MLETSYADWAIGLRQAYSARVRSALRTGASASSSWPTPDAGAMTRSNRSDSPNAAIRPLLAKLVQDWPTPTSRDWKDGACADGDVPTHALLGRAAPRFFLPDPENETLGAISSNGGLTSRPPSKRRLNPVFVEILQGLPRGWTDLKPLGIVWCHYKRRLAFAFSQLG